MADLVPPEIERYVEEHSTSAPPPLVELAEETRARLRSPQMLSGPVEGGLLQALAFVSGARSSSTIRTRSSSF